MEHFFNFFIRMQGKNQKIIDEYLEELAVEQEPRYFVDKEQVLCHYCRKRGHKFRDCTEAATRCNLCREDHDPMRCPLSEICYQCFQRGHVKTDCPNYGKQKYCEYCRVNGHSTMDCAKVWRNYITRVLCI